MAYSSVNTRRQFIFGITLTGCASYLAGIPKSVDGKEKEKEEVSPAEDLMREHGVLRRILLIYKEAIRRTVARLEVPSDAVLRAADIVRKFVEDYHERTEEDELFPRFRKANTMVPLVNTLYEQHQKGRILTDTILKLSTTASLQNQAEVMKLRDALAQFIRMYEPHAAQEDTILFPAFRKLVPAKEYDQLGDQFEEKEHKLFGEDGFEKNVEEVGNLEKALGIYDLAQFTPKI